MGNYLGLYIYKADLTRISSGISGGGTARAGDVLAWQFCLKGHRESWLEGVKTYLTGCCVSQLLMATPRGHSTIKVHKQLDNDVDSALELLRDLEHHSRVQVGTLMSRQGRKP